MRLSLLLLILLGLRVACAEGIPDILPTTGSSNPDGKHLYKRDAFEKLTKGLSGPKLIAVLGKPETTRTVSPGYPKNNFQIWTYKHVTRNPITNKEDEETRITLRYTFSLRGGEMVWTKEMVVSEFSYDKDSD